MHKLDHLRAPAIKERVGGDEQCIDSPLAECLEGGIDIVLGAGVLEDNSSARYLSAAALTSLQLDGDIGTVRIDEHAKIAPVGLIWCSSSSRFGSSSEVRPAAREVASRTVETGDEPALHSGRQRL